KDKPTSAPVKLVPFNPNTADSLTFCGLGLRSYVVKNILNYRRKGGSFRKSADFSKIYGLDPETFARLEPLIQMEGQEYGDGMMVQGPSVLNRTDGAGDLKKNLQTNKIAQASTNKPNDADKKDVSSNKPTEVDVASSTASTTSVSPTFDLNTADTTLLQQLKGAGSFTANRIARYRNQLGGFYSMSQLSEIKGLYPETLARLQSMLKIDPSRIQTLDANKASLEKLRAHPYLSFYQAKVIVELRKARGKINAIDALKTFKEFTTEDLERLKWYLRF
ncbi:MAG: helix-hairpin-helix domain-containing protein, partial [Bacteroidia bacterium]|nr:helix-hairpin-helix domain-containing protein [Bacteroidia bacterium]